MMIPTLISFMQTRKNYKEESAQSHTVSKGLDEHQGMYIGNCIVVVLYQFLQKFL